MPYLPVIGLSPQHLRSHPESRAHQRQLPLHILHRHLHHFPGQPKVSHQRLATPRHQSNEAVLKGARGAWHETPTEERLEHFTEQHLLSPTSPLQAFPSPETCILAAHMECAGQISGGLITSEARKSPLKKGKDHCLFNKHEPQPFI